MNNYVFAKRAEDVVNRKSLYVMGAFGAPLADQTKHRYITEQAYNNRPDRRSAINAATPDTFAFDCVGLIKGILWGWEGDLSEVYGGAIYASNGVPDIDADTMLDMCDDISTDFDSIEIGEVVGMTGHIGIYIGGGAVVESTPSWSDGVQITHTRRWDRHGKLPWITYEEEDMRIFKDVNPSAWYAEEVEKLAEIGVISGDGDGNFRPEDTATRAEVAAMIYRAIRHIKEG